MELFKKLVLDQLVKAAIQRLFLALPVLGWGPIGWIVTYIINKFVTFLYVEMELHIDIQKIVFKNEKLEKKYADESIKLKVFAANFGTDSEEYKNVEKATKQSFYDFISYDFAA